MCVRTSMLGILTPLTFRLHTFIIDPVPLGESCRFLVSAFCAGHQREESNRVKHTQKTHEPVV